MLNDQVLEKMADVLIWGMFAARSGSGGTYQLGDIILIRYDDTGRKLAEIVHRNLLEKDLIPTMEQDNTCKMERDFYNYGNERHFKFLSPWSKLKAKSITGLIAICSDEELFHLKDADPAKISMAMKAHKPIRKIRDEKESCGNFGWTLCSLPTIASASAAKMSLEEYSQQVIKACWLQEANPVETWIKIMEEVQGIKEWLKSLTIERIHVESTHIDLMLELGEDRKWLGVSGHNIPSFEIFTCPDARKTNGHFYADQPSFRQGNLIREVTLEFKNGKSIKSNATEGEEYLNKQLETDKGAEYIGEFSLTDRRFSKIDKFMASTLYDENYGGKYGNCHIAIGSSFPDAYGGNKPFMKIRKKLGFNDSAIHWDLINQQPKIVTAHSKKGKTVIYEDGQFKY